VPRKKNHHEPEFQVTEKLGYCLKAALKKKAFDILAIDLRAYTTVADYFVICSGSSNRQVQAIAESIELDLKKHKFYPLGIEGFTHGSWILLDYGDIVMHVFYQPVREFYELERLWADAPKVALDGRDESLHPAERRS
jgi:ribosome-associated protein